MRDQKMTASEWHRKQAARSFNATWDLIEKQDRTPDDDLQMIHTAHASRFHWGEIGTPLEFTRGEWQLSRVYALTGMGESALYHARHALEICLDHRIGDFDLAFAYEAMARACSTAGDRKRMKKYIAKAEEAAGKIEKQEDRDYFLSELATIGKVKV
ncbi:hypothetical protein [Alteribacter natronophilus]|uniref:hypothetical protein n=1 Tax=Alteribacter natronophilus TaxID=2583810 RepID=UPI00110E1D04|nr:hypothetical protein [Alteribacter natronophilus]TMW72053.1 hypothetical protein FGB90_07475 [Alteribacter natronophilus]